MREQWTDESAVRSARDSPTYAAALSGTAEARHQAPHDHSIVHSPEEGRRRHRDDSLRSYASDLRERKYYSNQDGSQRNHNHTGGDTGALGNRLLNSDFGKRKVGCYNCGEFNHVQATCRFDHKLLCGFCRRLGHKSRLCQYYSA